MSRRRSPKPAPEEVAPVPPSAAWTPAEGTKHWTRAKFAEVKDMAMWWRQRDNEAKREHREKHG